MSLQILLYSSPLRPLEILRITSVGTDLWDFPLQGCCLGPQHQSNFKWPNHACESALILKRKYRDCKNGLQRIIIPPDSRFVMRLFSWVMYRIHFRASFKVCWVSITNRHCKQKMMCIFVLLGWDLLGKKGYKYSKYIHYCSLCISKEVWIHL